MKQTWLSARSCGGGTEPPHIPSRDGRKNDRGGRTEDGRSPTARGGGATGKTRQANKQNDAMMHQRWEMGASGRPKKAKTRGRSEDDRRCDPHMGRSCTREHNNALSVQAVEEPSKSPVGDVLAGGQNTRQDSPLYLYLRRTSCCFRRDEKGSILELHCQFAVLTAS